MMKSKDNGASANLRTIKQSLPPDSSKQAGIALKLEKNQAVAAEVKRQKKNLRAELLATKMEHLKNKLLPHYHIEMICLGLEDM